MDILGTISEISPPPQGKKKSLIKFVDNDKWVYCWPNEAARYQVGEQVSLPCEINNFNGRDLYNLQKTSNGSAPNAAPAPRPQAAPAPVSAPGFVQAPEGKLMAKATIAAACIQAGVGTETADQWIAWLKGEKPTKMAAVPAQGVEVIETVDVPFEY